MTITAEGLAALITAFGIAAGAIGGVIVGIINARHNAGLMDQQKKEYEAALEAIEKKHAAEIGLLTLKISAVESHSKVQDSALVDRESELNRLTFDNEVLRRDNKILRIDNEILNEKIAKWHEWGFEIGHLMNKMYLQLGYLTRGKFETGPLPELPANSDNE